MEIAHFRCGRKYCFGKWKHLATNLKDCRISFERRVSLKHSRKRFDVYFKLDIFL